MTDDFTTLFDALLALRMDWQETCDRYRSTVTSHLRTCVDGVGGRPDVLALISVDLIRFTVALEQLSKSLEMLDEVILRMDELRVARYQLAVPPVDSGSPQGDGDASTSTRAPGAAGPRRRSESGQHKSGETDLNVCP